MNRLNKNIILILIAAFLVIFIPIKVNAGLQANKGGTSKVNTTASDFFSKIRQMESTDGTLAVDNTYGIDCHMAKNTEWGTAAMMAASSFGTTPTANTENSTTGNESGVYQMAGGKWEYTANYFKDTTQSFAANIKNAADKYKNEYAGTGTRFPGDALSLGSLSRNWNASKPVVARGYNSIFGYYGSGYISEDNDAYGGKAAGGVSSRAAVVCGQGL